MEKRRRTRGLGLGAKALIVVAATIAGTVGSWAGCALDSAKTVSKDGLTVSYRPVGGAIVPGTFFVLELVACDTEGRPANLTSVDAVMPAHGHGMNYKPVVTQTAQGRFQAEGMMFHMTGVWQFRFRVVNDDVNVMIVSDRDVTR